MRVEPWPDALKLMLYRTKDICATGSQLLSDIFKQFWNVAAGVSPASFIPFGNSPQKNNHMRLRGEPPHQCLFDLLEKLCRSPGGISHKYGRVVVASAWDKQKGKRNIDRIDDIPLFVMPVASSHTPFWSKQDKTVWACLSDGLQDKIPSWLWLLDALCLPFLSNRKTD